MAEVNPLAVVAECIEKCKATTNSADQDPDALLDARSRLPGGS
jgi:hypothetical protein